MDAKRWQQIERLYHEALDRPAAERLVFLAAACGDDDALRREVGELLQNASISDRRFGGPAFAAAAGTIGDSARTVLTGRQLGIYHLQECIGAGGMADVYRARDTKLGRDVAVKVLPRAFSDDPDRLARFAREARALAVLNHPNIATIHGIEEGDGIKALVMELVEGETLADRLSRGALPMREALTIARQIATALETAHEHNIVHRDLKPANIKVRSDGTVKVLDFGLAKVSGQAAPDSAEPSTTTLVTEAGMIVGTAPYMSPEQARGLPADKRVDTWAFGCVLFEMLTGRRTFGGATVQDTIAKVLTAEPDWSLLPQALHPRIRLLLERCLERDPKDRYHDIADARVDLQKVLESADVVVSRASQEVAAGASNRWWLRTAALVIAAVVVGAAGFAVRSSFTPDPPPIARFSHVMPEGAMLSPGIAVSPDGASMVYASGGRLYVRSLDQFEARQIAGPQAEQSGVGAPGIAGPMMPFFSPDGQSVGYVTAAAGRARLSKVPIGGGTPVPIVEASGFFGAKWEPDGTILYGQNDGIWRVPAAAGKPEQLVSLEPGQMAHGPQMLPASEWMLFTFTAGVGESRWDDDARIVAQSLRTGERKVLVEGASNARYLRSGHLVYAQRSTLHAVPFDPAALEVTGEAVPVLEGIRRLALFPGSSGLADYSISNLGTLTYIVGGGAPPVVPRLLVAVDRQGRSTPLVDERRDYWRPRVSPDGTRVAVEVRTQDGLHIWIVDLASRNATQLTYDGTSNWGAVWSHDGRFVVYVSDREPYFGAYMKAADGSGETTLLRRSDRDIVTVDASRDGVLSFTEGGDTGERAIWTLRFGDRSAAEFLATPSLESMPLFSPDGRWLAYMSNESGRPEVYVRPYPRRGTELTRVSEGGGTAPVWSRDGSTLYFRDVSTGRETSGWLMAVPVRAGATFSAGRPVPLFLYSGRFRFSGQLPAYDVAPKGDGFIMTTEPEDARPAPGRMHVVLNWDQELKRLVPAN